MLCENNICCNQTPVYIIVIDRIFGRVYMWTKCIVSRSCFRPFKMKDHRLKTNRNMVIDVNESKRGQKMNNMRKEKKRKERKKKKVRVKLRFDYPFDL
ncbi:hypothetical protein V1477_001015 [Vespula maculifrons]|uniref:Uncharacterized protein n=1 Tax=Vespula maculifrons TaxID=7453 RepID=A0ABD2D0J5_VESMC